MQSLRGVCAPVLVACAAASGIPGLSAGSPVWDKSQGKPAKAQRAPIAVAQHVPAHHPPSLPAYQGQVLHLPHPDYRPATPRPSPAPIAPKPAPPPPRPAARPSPPSPKPPTPRTTAGLAPTAPVFRPPERDDRGKPIKAAPLTNLTQHAAIVHETIAKPAVARYVSTIAQMKSGQDSRYHWYKLDGVRFAHRYDGDHDRHWFGFYQGPAFYWTIYWRDHFWWQEARTRRWLSFWRNHWWWWCAPRQVYYVYIGDQFYQWNPTPSSVVLVPAESPPPSAVDPVAGGTGFDAPPSTSFESTRETLVASPQPVYYYSADGTRLVQVEGQELTAYLYDNTQQGQDGNHPLIRYLSEGVTDVQFSDTGRGAPLQIVLSVQESGGAFRHVALDKDGNPLAGAPAAPVAPAGQPTQIDYGAPGAPGFDAPEGDLPPTEPPLPDGE